MLEKDIGYGLSSPIQNWFRERWDLGSCCQYQLLFPLWYHRWQEFAFRRGRSNISVLNFVFRLVSEIKLLGNDGIPLTTEETIAALFDRHFPGAIEPTLRTTHVTQPPSKKL